MPKTFTENERTHIKKRLMEEAENCLMQYGMRKTTIDELVKRVNIPKGTFYLFYSSKEMLFFDVLCKIHDELHDTLLGWIDKLDGDINTDTMTELLFRLYKQADAIFLYTFAVSGEMEMLMRKLPPEVVYKHTQKDDFSMETLLKTLFKKNDERDIKIYSAVFRAIFCTILNKREIGQDVYDDVIRIMLRGAVMQLFEEDRK